MTAHALYTQTLSEYKSRLISSPCLTLRSYCHECHVNYHGMELWLSRHGIRIRELRSSLSASSSEKPVGDLQALYRKIAYIYQRASFGILPFPEVASQPLSVYECGLCEQAVLQTDR